MNVIYVDELFFLNALTDYLLLLSCARLRGSALRRRRFAAAAAVAMKDGAPFAEKGDLDEII